MIAGILLAAGRSTRFGGNKLLATIDGRSVIARSAASLSCAVEETIVVMPPAHDTLATELRAITHRVAVNPDPARGMASSISVGVQALSPAAEAVVIALADQPLVRSRVIERLVEAWQTFRPPVVVPCYRDGRGHPVLFDRACFAQLMALEGDRGAASLIDAVGAGVHFLPVDHTMPLDVDTPDALGALLMEARGPIREPASPTP